MIEYFLYKFGFFLANNLPLRVNYFISRIFSILQYLVAFRDRKAVMQNQRIISGKQAHIFSKGALVYQNFGLYLVDFFRFGKIDKNYIDKHIKVTGKSYLDEALDRKHGAIALTAHLGNWELGGVVVSNLGYPIYGVALPHKDKKVDEFFNRQRKTKGLNVIPLGIAVRRCYQLLRENKIVALVADKDFSQKSQGIRVKFLGREAFLPKGPAVLALRTHAAIVPGFMLREPGYKYKLVFEKPIYPPMVTEFDDNAVIELMQQYIPILEKYIRENSTQWFMFREFWK